MHLSSMEQVGRSLWSGFGALGGVCATVKCEETEVALGVPYKWFDFIYCFYLYLLTKKELFINFTGKV